MTTSSGAGLGDQIPKDAALVQHETSAPSPPVRAPEKTTSSAAVAEAFAQHKATSPATSEPVQVGRDVAVEKRGSLKFFVHASKLSGKDFGNNNLNQAVSQFNQERTEANLDNVLERLKQIPHQKKNKAIQKLLADVMKNKMQFISQRNDFHFLTDKAVRLSYKAPQDNDNPLLDNLSKVVEAFNKKKTKETCKAVLEALFSYSMVSSKKMHQSDDIQQLLRELAVGIEDKALKNLSETKIIDGTIAVVVKRIFSDYPDIHSPKAKKRGFTLTNLNKETGFVIKYFKYLAQIVRRWSDDKYAGLRVAVERFNQEKTETNIAEIIKHINLLKSEDGKDFNDTTLAQIANEVMIQKIQMMAAEDAPKMTFSKKSAMAISKNEIPDRDIQEKIKAYNEDKCPATAHELMIAVFDWMKNDRTRFSKYTSDVQKVLYELGKAIKEPQLGELFGILKTERTLIAYQKIGALEAKAKLKLETAFNIEGTPLNIPQVNTWFSRFRGKELRAVREAIVNYNRTKNPENFRNVLDCLKHWQYTNNNQFNSSNGLKIISEMNDILSEISLQARIKKTDSYEFYKIYKGLNKKNRELIAQGGIPNPKWESANWNFKKWSPLPAPYKRGHTPSAEMQTVLAGVKKFNSELKLGDRGPAMLELYSEIQDWIRTQPIEFNRCGGERVLRSIQKNIINSVSTLSFNNLNMSKSNQFESVRAAIITYNNERSLVALEQVKTAIGIWKEAQPNQISNKGNVIIGEFHRFQGADFEARIDTLLNSATTADEAGKKMSMPSILLPDSHPTQVFERTLALKDEADGGQSAYLMIFHNPIAPWSHTDIGFVTGAPPMTSKTFAGEPEVLPDLEIYFENGLKVKDFDEKDFPKHRMFLRDLKRYITGPQEKMMVRAQKDFINCNIEGASAEGVYKFLREKGFIDEHGKVQPKYFAEVSYDVLKEGGFSDNVINVIVQNMPPVIIPSKLALDINKAKADDAFEFFKKQGYLDENNQVDKRYLFQDSPMFKAIENYFEGDNDFIDFLKAVIATPTPRSFNPESLLTKKFTPAESQQLFQFLKEKGVMVAKTNSKGEEVLFLNANWKDLLSEEVLSELPPTLQPFREAIIHKLLQCTPSGEVSKRDYLGIGADPKSLDTSSQHAEGVRLTDPRLVTRLQKLCKRRKNEIQRNMNVFAGASGGIRGMTKGGYASLLVSEEDRIRHFRQALIDNFLTTRDPQSFLPNLKETRYRLELYESGGEVYKKWVEDPNGQFSKVKNPSSQDVSGEFQENEYRHNSYALVDGKLKSVKTMDKDRLEGQEKGNIVQKADGTQVWQADDKFGQYFKPKGAPVSEAVKDERPLYSAMNCEKYLSNGESEWCGSCVIRLLQGAYAHEYMPEFQKILQSLEEDFNVATGFQKDSSFEKRHAGALFLLAEQYAKKLVKSEVGKKYFRDMNPTVRLSPRCTPDMIHEFLMGKSPGVVNSMKRAWKTVQMPDSRGQRVEGLSQHASHGAAETGLGILAIPTATLKLVANVASAVTGTVIDTFVTAPQQAAQLKSEQLARKQEAHGAKPLKFKAVKIARAAVGGFIKKGLIKRIAGDLVGIEDVVDSVKSVTKKKERSAFA